MVLLKKAMFLLQFGLTWYLLDQGANVPMDETLPLSYIT